MKDVLLINFFSKNESSYVQNYIDILKDNNISFDSLYFERYDMTVVENEGEFLFKQYCPTGGNKFNKIRIMLKYAIFIRNIIRKGNYKGIVIFTTPPAIMVCDLLRKYKKRYILDIRDFTYENNSIIYTIEKQIIKNSFATVISSEGFKEFLPKEFEYVITHNVANTNAVNKKHNKKNKHTIGFVGSVRYYEENKALINHFKNDPKYNLVYYGTVTNDCDLESYCVDNNINNVNFKGRYDNSKKGELYNDIDIINSIYGIKGLETTTALPNRLYDAALYKCPIMVSKGTYLAEIVQEYKLGIVVDVFKDDVKQEIDNYLANYNDAVFSENCDIFLKKVIIDMSNHKKTVSDFAKRVK